MATQKKILIVEDEKSLREAMEDFLRLKNFTTLVAKNGKEGVAIALAEHPDLILMDLIMPEMDGMAALQEIRKDVWGAWVPVIILTNLSVGSGDRSAYAATQLTEHYLIKSDWKLRDIAKKIEAILDAIGTL